ncbi:peroxisome assembly protein 26-like isoform X2 [Anneissia japonica]|uniref:peroxisome assembly protein 26-like isoform X2 n=1 Tax=Anneissia japonica TaxID=1529436 RepID=UPI001425602D|nr:peroxisome assembly protein 26-like isoform X2 [Anneissia japonica]
MSADECHTQSVGKVNLVELATGLLILGKFDEVYKLCQKGLAKCVAVTTTLEEAGCGSKNGIGNAHHHLDEENEASCRNSHIEKRKHRQKKPHFSDLMKECLCIIAVQALAEMNRWQDVLPFLQSQYGPVQQLPAKLVQLCMLLHVHINKHQEAEVLYKQYSTLSTKKISSEQHTQLTELLFSHVLFPQEKWTEAAKVIESDCILRTDKKLALLKVLKEKERCQKRESGSIVSQSIVEDTEPMRENRQGNVLFLMASKVSLFFYRWIPKTYWNHLSSLAMVGICTYLVLRHNSANSSMG